MRITDSKKGDGPEITPKFNRGDSWRALDGKHAECHGRQTVLGIGVRPNGTEGLLLRCTGCFRSYVLVPTRDEQ